MAYIHTITRLVLILLCSSCVHALPPVGTRMLTRPQDRDKTIQVINETNYYNGNDSIGEDDPAVMMAITPEVTQSLRSSDITNFLFGIAINPSPEVPARTITIQGSAIEDRSPYALLADYFYLPPDYMSDVTFSPRITNILINFDLLCNFKLFCHDLYVRLYGPVTVSFWKLNYCENIILPGTLDYPAGYFAPTAIPARQLLPSFSSYAQGCFIAPLDQPVFFNPLRAARMNPHTKTSCRFAALRAELGYHVVFENDYRCSINMQGAAPTGNNPDASSLFAPQIGSHHWELGAGFSGYYTLWRDCFDDIAFAFTLDANITHLFTSTQCRTFDLKCSPLSRYMLAIKMDDLISFNLQGNGQTPLAQFAQEIAPLANLTTHQVSVHINVQADIVAMLSYCNEDFRWDLGYNFWTQSREQITHCSKACIPYEKNQWALKGDARIFGFAGTGGSLAAGTAVPLSATESQATIFNGTNDSPGLLDPNTGIDDPALATAGIPPQPLLRDPSGSIGNPQLNSSLQPIIITADQIDYDSHTHAISHKLFSAISYTWANHCHMPFITLGGFAEFASSKKYCTTVVPDECCKNGSVNGAINQWGIFLSGGWSI